MKKIVTILLLVLLLFNFVGYKLLFFALDKKADNIITATINSDNYSDADLITLTVPLSMPYITDSKDFESKDGEIIVDGKIYHYVKQKISQGNLILKCLPDEQKTHLQNAKDDFFRLANELQNNNASSKKSGESSQLVKLVISDYEEFQTTSIHHYPTRVNASLFTGVTSFALLKGAGITPEQPPEA